MTTEPEAAETLGTAAEGSRSTPVPSPSAPSARGSLVRLAIVLAVIVAVFVATGLSNLLIFIVALALIVVVHELGHYLTAKWSHMKVTEFFIGFGPRLWSIRKGETDYGVKPILAGAYVKIPGMTNLEEVDPADEARTYRRQPFRKRVLVASAGSIMHYVMALLLAWIVAMAVGVPTAEQVAVAGFSAWSGHHETAAQIAGMKPGERIVSVDGKKITTATQLVTAIDASHGSTVPVVVERNGHRSTLSVTPQAGHVTKDTTEVLGPGTGTGKERTRWLIGVDTTVSPLFTPKNPASAVAWAGSEVGNVTKATVLGLGHVFSPGGISSLFDQVTNPQAAEKAAANPTSSNRIMSVVETARIATQAYAAGPYYFIAILIALNIALGLLNMLPMLPLDGGHVAIALYERVRTRKGRPRYQADVAKLLPVAYTFMAALLVIVGAAVFLDIAHPLANPFG